MSRRQLEDFLSRSKWLLFQVAIFIIFSVMLADFVWTEISPFVRKIFDALR